MTLKHKFQLPIGDWSSDGHEKCDYHIMYSNKPITEIRESHFAMIKMFPKFEKLFSEYEQYSTSFEELEDIFNKVPATSELFEDADEEEIVLKDDQSRNMAELWRLLVTYADARLVIEFPELDVDNIPMLAFYGVDHKKRHIGHIGYGLFC